MPREKAKSVIEILDVARVGDRYVLLDGKGCELPPDAEPVYMPFAGGDIQCNSRGEPFSPQFPIRHQGEKINGLGVHIGSTSLED